MPPKTLQTHLTDPYIEGKIQIYKGDGDRLLVCEKCDTPVQVRILIEGVELPNEIDPARTIITKNTTAGNKRTSIQLSYIGINCGCYARFHRQVAHIVDAQKVASKLSTT